MAKIRTRVPRIPKIRRSPSQAEIDRVVTMLNERARLHEDHDVAIHYLRQQLDIQFTRIAQLQMEVDGLKKRRR